MYTGTYTGTFHNGYCCGDWSVDKAIGGLTLDNNIYSFPPTWLETLKELAMNARCKVVDVRIQINFEVDQVFLSALPTLAKHFENTYAQPRLPYKALPGATDLRPAPVSYAMFPEVSKIVGASNGWEKWGSIAVIQEGGSPIVEIQLSLLEGETLGAILSLLGYKST